MKIGIFLALLITSLVVQAENGCDFPELNKNWKDVWPIEFQSSPDTILTQVDHCLKNQENIKNIARAIDNSFSNIYSEEKSKRETIYSFNKSIIKYIADKEIPLFQFYFAWLHNNNLTWLSELEPKDYYTFIYWAKKAASKGDANAKFALVTLSEGSFLTRYSNAPESMFFPFLTLNAGEAITTLNTIDEKQINSVFQTQGSIENLRNNFSHQNESGDLNVKPPEFTSEKNYRKPVWLKGYIADKHLITMILYPNGNTYTGIYFYDRAYKKWKSSFPIKGKRTKNNLIIEALDKQGKPVEKFELTIKGEKNEEIYYADGNWVSENQKHTVELGDIALFDDFVSCEEMQLAPNFVFTRELDFGMGIASNTTDVATDCPLIADNNEFAKKAFKLANDIRLDPPRVGGCGGTGMYIRLRVEFYNMAMAAYAPEIFNERYQSTFSRNSENLKKWSAIEHYNKETADQFSQELKNIKPRLKKLYIESIKGDESSAEVFSIASTEALLHYAVGGGDVEFEKPEIIRLYENKGIAALTELKINTAELYDIQQSLNYSLLNEYPDELIIGLIELNTELNYGNESPLFYAIKNTKYLNLLLKKGADINYQNSFGKTPIFYAIQGNDIDMVEFLISKGANINHKYKSKADYSEEEKGSIDYYCINKKGRTTLMHAAQHASLEMVKLLANKGVDSKATDDNGDTASDYAKNANRIDILNYLSTL